MDVPGGPLMSQGSEDMIVILFTGYSSATAAVGAFDAVSAVFEGHDPACCSAAVIDPHDMDVSSRVLRETLSSRQGQGVGAQVEGLARRLGRYLAEGLA